MGQRIEKVVEKAMSGGACIQVFFTLASLLRHAAHPTVPRSMGTRA